MDNNQNVGQPMNDAQQYYGQPVYYEQAMYVQPQQYGQPQQMPGYGYQQPNDPAQQQYQNMQQPYGQQQYYGQQQMGYNQPQMDYNQQMSYNQPQMNYNQQMYAYQPQGYGGEATPKKPIPVKKIIAVVAALAAVILAVIFIPKLFHKVQPPFEDVELGLTAEEAIEKYDIKEEDAHSMDAYKNDVEGFGVKGDLQLCFYDDTLFMVNWYVYEHQCDEDELEKAFEEALEYYTDKYGEPEIEERYETVYVWEYEDGAEFEIEVGDDFFVIRVVNFDLM